MIYLVGVDIGGTFTDLVCMDEGGEATVIKTPSTPAEPGEAVIVGLRKLSGVLGLEMEALLSNVSRICHGTTVTTNAILTGNGAKVGLLITKGFRDSLEIRMGMREDNYDYTMAAPSPLVPRHLRKGIEERVRWNGEEIVGLNEDEVREAVKYFKKQGVESIAICYLWSFKNDGHEVETARICKEEFPDAYLSVSSECSPEIRDFRRVSTTVINAFVGPPLSKYVLGLEKNLKKEGYKGNLLITQSSSGVMSPEVASKQAMRTVLSGPACAPAAGVYLGKAYDMKNLMTTDMGGTSFDVALIKNGKPCMTPETKVAGYYLLRLPLVDVTTIGTGGGSVAWLESGGILHVGPKSAGADPGPACYSHGGTEPTSTDADLDLGHLNPDFFLGGEIKLSLEAAEQAIREKISDPLGLSVIEGAQAIRRIVDHNMVNGMSAVSVRRGEDPREYAMVAVGGAGPVHATDLAKSLGMTQILVPRYSSIFCALGGVISDLRHDYVKTMVGKVREIDLNELNSNFEQMENEATELLVSEGCAVEDIYFRRSMDMRYVRQFHEVEIEVSEGILGQEELTEVINRFHSTHESLYSYRDDAETEILNVRLAGFSKVAKPFLNEIEYEGNNARQYIKGEREVYFGANTAPVVAKIYNGDDMKGGNELMGPAIVEQEITTIVVPEKSKLKVTKYGDFMIYLS
jgi:N-methylhydantoinase A